MKDTRIIMGMPITVEIIDEEITLNDLEKTFTYFDFIDHKFSPFKEDSEVSLINRGEISDREYSEEMRSVLLLSQETKELTSGYFDVINPTGQFNPSGLVKGWAVNNAANRLLQDGFENFYIEAGGDIEAYGKNAQGQNWSIGIRNPFDLHQIIKVLYLENCGVATSGTYLRGQHIYNPKAGKEPITDVVSLTVIGPNIFEADRFATAAFAMGREGINFIEGIPGLEAFMVDQHGLATLTSGFEKYLVPIL